jgi:integrase
LLLSALSNKSFSHKADHHPGCLHVKRVQQASDVSDFWCYQATRPSDGHRVEQPVRLGLVSAIGSDMAAWREVGRLNLIEKHILNPTQGQPTFGWLANHYIRDGLPFNKRNGKRKSKGTVYNYQHSLDEFILPRWENEVAARIKPLAVRNWLYSVHDEQDYDWQTVSKIKMVMGQVFGHADMYDLESCLNPIQKVMIPGSEDTDREARVLQPEETLEIVSRLDISEKVLVVLIAATAVRISEALALQWLHIDFKANCIHIEQAFRLAEITTTKTKSSKADVPMCGLLADYLHYWRSQTPYHRDMDYVFASDKLKGSKPRCGQMVNRDYLKPAAVAAGIIKQEERFGFHSLRHSLSTWVNRNLKDVKIAQTLLRHSKPDITAGTYIHSVPEQNLKAQEQYMGKAPVSTVWTCG